MAEKTLAQKLAIKEGKTVLVVAPPRGYLGRLGALPGGAKLLKSTSEPVDIIQVFVADQEDLEAQLANLKGAMAPDGMLWVSYHKGSSGIPTDINRDTIRAYASAVGLQAVAQVAIDDDWSALRLKLAE